MGEVTRRSYKNKNRIKSSIQHQPFQQTDIRSVDGGDNSSREGRQRGRRKRKGEGERVKEEGVGKRGGEERNRGREGQREREDNRSVLVLLCFALFPGRERACWVLDLIGTGIGFLPRLVRDGNIWLQWLSHDSVGSGVPGKGRVNTEALAVKGPFALCREGRAVFPSPLSAATVTTHSHN